VIIDGFRGGFEFIPNDLVDIIQEAKNQTMGSLYQAYGQENEAALDEYIDFLVEKEYVFFVNERERDLFPDLPKQWMIPARIGNAILDVQDTGVYDLEKAIAELDELQCPALQIRIFTAVPFEWLIRIMQAIDHTALEHIELFVPYQENLSPDRLQWLVLNYQKITSLYIHGAPEDAQITENSIDRISTIAYLSEAITDEHHCGVVALPFFSTNINHYMESQEHNTCLNRKIAIDKQGYIRNCPSMPRHFGRFPETSLEDALKTPGFQHYWHHTKTQIDTCGVCEFRHICTDCRAYVADHDHDRGKPAKCSYDPHTASWAHQEGTVSIAPAYKE
jgi:SPASM domain peptide maturase of grasp-with-spasm system